MMNHPCRHAARFTAAFIVLALSACQHPADVGIEEPVNSAPPVGAVRKGTIGIGDILDIYVMEDVSLNGQFTVLESGNIVMPGIGRIHLAGNTLAAAQDIVRSRVETDQVKKATVILERARASGQVALAEQPKLQIFVSGAVSRPGQHRVPLPSQEGLSAFEALMTAGGPTTFADQRHAYVLRKTGKGERVRLPVDLLAVSRGESRDLQLQEGDVIVVPQRRFGL